jgi:transcriptional regulator with XRE-family HTH domain
MYMAKLGARVRRARKARGLTQSALAKQAGIARETLSQLESGVARELGFARVSRLLSTLDLDLDIQETSSARATDYVALGAAAGSTGFRDALGGEELIRAILSGEPPPRKSPHVRRLLEDSPPLLIAGLVAQVSQWAEPRKVRRGLQRLATKLEVAPRAEWTKPD